MLAKTYVNQVAWMGSHTLPKMHVLAAPKQ